MEYNSIEKGGDIMSNFDRKKENAKNIAFIQKAGVDISQGDPEDEDEGVPEQADQEKAEKEKNGGDNDRRG